MLLAIDFTPLITSIVPVAVVAILTYLQVYRKLSGKINTSEASELWKESNSLRQEYRDTIDKYERKISQLEGVVEEQRKKIRQLEREISDLKAQVHAH